MLHSFILKLIIYIFFPRVFPVSVNGEEMSVFAVRLPAKYSLEILKHPFTPFTSAVLYCTYLSSLCRTLCNTAYACVERAPICHWAACTSTKQYLVSGFNYRFACDSWKLRSFVLPLIHCEQSICCLSLLSVFPTLFFPPFFVLWWHALLSALLSSARLKCLAYLLKWKAFSVPRLSHCGPFTKYFWYCFTPPTLTTHEAPPKCKNPGL